MDLFHRQSPLFVAAYNGDYEAVSLLLGFGATQNGCSNEDRLLIHDGFLRDSPTEEWKIRPPLDGAVRVGHLRIVKPLIEHTLLAGLHETAGLLPIFFRRCKSWYLE